MGEWAADELEQCRTRITVLEEELAATRPWKASMDMQGKVIRELEQYVSELEKSLENARKERDAALARLKPSGQVAEDVKTLELLILGFEARRQERLPHTRAALSRLAAKAQGYEAAIADNAALVAEIERSYADALDAASKPHPGAGLLEEHRKEVQSLTADYAALKEALEDSPHADDCTYVRHYSSAPQRPSPENACDCHKAIAYKPHPGAALLLEAASLESREMQARQSAEEHRRAAENSRSALNNVLEKLREEMARHGMQCVEGGLVGILNGIDRVAVRAKNEGLEKAATKLDQSRSRALKEAEQYPVETFARRDWEQAARAYGDAAASIRAMMEPEGGQS